MSNLIEEAIREHWGERCPDFDPGCLGCLAWKAVDELASLRSDNERLRAENEALLSANRDVMLHWDVLRADYERLRAAMADNDLYVKTWSDDYDTTMAVLKDAYTVLAFAFQRIHSLPRSRDTELAADIGRCRAKIEKIIARAALGNTEGK